MNWQRFLKIMKAIDAREGSFLSKQQCDSFHNQRVTNPFVLTGRYFGYPECCIQSFVDGSAFRGDWETDKIVRFQQRYFIPCGSCAALIEKYLEI